MASLCNTNPFPSLGGWSLKNYCPHSRSTSLLGPLVSYKHALDIKHTNNSNLKELKKLHASDDM